MVAVLPIAPMRRMSQAWDSALRPKKCLLAVQPQVAEHGCE